MKCFQPGRGDVQCGGLHKTVHGRHVWQWRKGADAATEAANATAASRAATAAVPPSGTTAASEAVCDDLDGSAAAAAAAAAAVDPQAVFVVVDDAAVVLQFLLDHFVGVQLGSIQRTVSARGQGTGSRYSTYRDSTSFWNQTRN